VRVLRLAATALVALGMVLSTSPAGAAATFTVVRSPNVTPSDYNELDATASTGTADAWAVGFSRGNFPSPFRANIEHFNGRTWSIVPSAPRQAGLDTRLHGVAALSPSEAWAVGSQAGSGAMGSLIEHWNGTSWAVVASPANEPASGELDSITAVSAQNLWAVGGAGGFPLIEHFDGQAWSVVPSPSLPRGASRLLSVGGSSSTDVWAVGAQGSRHPTPVIEHFDGLAWSLVSQPVGGYDSALRSVAVIGPDDAWAVGEQNLAQTVTEHWDGTSWSLVPSPYPTANNAQNMLAGVAAFGAKDVWAVGSTLNNFSSNQTLALHWDGTAWSIVPSPNPSPGLNILAGVGGTVAGRPLWAVGSQVPSSAYHTMILRATA
jgi:hypothetical protein